MSEVEAHECVAGLQYSKQNGSVCLCARVWLHVGILSSEEFAYTVDGELLHLVNHTASAIVALARITLGILVGEVRTHSLHHLVTDKILRSNQFHAFQLALVLFLDKVKNLLISFHFFFCY